LISLAAALVYYQEYTQFLTLLILINVVITTIRVRERERENIKFYIRVACFKRVLHDFTKVGQNCSFSIVLKIETLAIIKLK
jgi:hypothetical protein